MRFTIDSSASNCPAKGDSILDEISEGGDAEEVLIRYCCLGGMIKDDGRPELVDVHVGSDMLDSKRIFNVSKPFLCSASEFFDKALNGRFKEGATGQIDLPDILPATFASFLHWLIADTIYPSYVADDMPTGGTLILAVRVAIFGDRIRNTKLQNTAIRAIYGLARYCDIELDLMQSSLDETYKGTPPEHPLRKLLAVICALQFLYSGLPGGGDRTKGDKSALLECINEHESFMEDFWCQITAIAAGGSPFELPEKVDAYLVKRYKSGDA